MKKIIWILVVLILGAGLYAWLTNKKDVATQEEPVSVAESTSEVPDGWEVYADDMHGFSLSFPSSYEARKVQGQGATLLFIIDPSSATEKSSGHGLSLSLGDSMPTFLPYQQATTQIAVVNGKTGKRFTYLSDIGAGRTTQYTFEIPAGFLSLSYELYAPEVIAAAEGIIATLRY